MTNHDKLHSVFRRVFQVSSQVPVNAATYGDSLDGGKLWDSLKHMVLCTQLEDAFDVMIDIELVAKIKSYGDAVAALQKLGVAFED
jgi:acyl carrier protein